MNDQIKSKARVREHAEVFTAEREVKAIYLPNDDVRVIDFCLRCENEKCNGDKCPALKLYERELRSKKKCQKNLRSKI